MGLKKRTTRNHKSLETSGMMNSGAILITENTPRTNHIVWRLDVLFQLLGIDTIRVPFLAKHGIVREIGRFNEDGFRRRKAMSKRVNIRMRRTRVMGRIVGR